MRLFRLLTIGVVFLVFVGGLLGTACARVKVERDAGGVGIQSIVNNGDGTFTVHLSNEMEYTTDNMTGPQGEKGDIGARGIQGEPGPNMIVAMGNIESGVVRQGYNITSCVWDDNATAYVITLTGNDYEASNYVTLVTPSGPYITTYSGLNGKLYAYIVPQNSTTGIEGSFCFMVLKTP